MTCATSKHDQERILRLLTAQGPLSQLELARLTRLQEGTVSHLVQDLTGLELVRDRGPFPSAKNTPGEGLLGLCPASSWAVGLDLHSNGIKLCLINGAGQIIAQQKFPPPADITRFANKLTLVIAHHAERLNLAPGKSAGVGVSVPGLVNPATGVVSKSDWNWKDFALGELLEKELGSKVHVERDVVCGAYGEKYVGRARNCENFLYILIHPARETTADQSRQSYGYGLAIVLEGRVHRGSNYAAGELGGILTLDMMNAEMNLDSEDNGPEISGLIHSLGRTAGGLTNLIDPEMIILCADHHLLNPTRMEEVEKVARQEIVNIDARRFQLTLSRIGLDGLSYGAAVLRLHQNFENRLNRPPEKITAPHG